MTVKTGSAWAGSFVTLDSTGALSASADAAGTLYVDGTADAATVTITGSNPYKWSVTLPSLTAGQRCDMYITGTIDSVATAGFVASEQADTALVSEVKTDTAAILADTGTDGVKIASGELSTVATALSITALDGKIDTIKAKTDQLDVSSTSFVTAVRGSTITILRGDTFSGDLLNLGDLTQYASLDFTVKRVAGELDDAAKIRLRKNASGTDDGLLRINGAEYATATDGSIVIDDLTTGDIEIKLNAAATQELVPGNYVYDIQMISAAGVKTLTYGKLIVSADVTRLVA